MDTLLSDIERSAQTSIHDKLTQAASRQCMEALKLVRSITSQYRHTNKPPPSEASHFIPTLFKPFKSFLAEHAAWIRPETKVDWSRAVANTVISRYNRKEERIWISCFTLLH